MDNTHQIKVEAAYITLASENLQVLVEFYRRLLGCPPVTYIPERYAEFAVSGLRLALFKPNVDHQKEFIGPASSMSICLEVESLEDAIETLTSLGYPPPGKIIHASHGKESYAYDPAKNRLILHQSNPSD
ncbi:MAG: glyoxalase [Leptolyngbya sp. SIO3F4]|nr:glyoxalase [Leptolyngbya sp. SIO3F4]